MVTSGPGKDAFLPVSSHWQFQFLHFLSYFPYCRRVTSLTRNLFHHLVTLYAIHIVISNILQLKISWKYVKKQGHLCAETMNVHKVRADKRLLLSVNICIAQGFEPSENLFKVSAFQIFWKSYRKFTALNTGFKDSYTWFYAFRSCSYRANTLQERN